MAKEAGVNEATLFLYFRSKGDIFDAAITQSLKELISLQVAEGKDFYDAHDTTEKKAVAELAHSQIFGAFEKIGPLAIAGLFSDKAIGVSLYKKIIVPALQELTKTAKLSFSIRNDKQAEVIVLTSLGLGFALHVHGTFTDTKVDKDHAARFIADLMTQFF